MKPLIIISAVVLFFVLLLAAKARVRIETGDPLKVRAGLGPVLIKIFPRKKKRKKVRLSKFSQKKYLSLTEKLKKERSEKKAEEEEEKAKKNAESEDGGKKNLSRRIEEIKSLAEFAVKTAGKYSKKICVNVKRLHVTVGGEDAAETAKKYGIVAQGLAYLTEILPGAVTFRADPGAVSADADFLSGKITFAADATVGIRLINVLRIGLAVLTRKSGGREDK